MTQTVRNTRIRWRKCNLALSLSELWALVSRTNKYIDETSPWVLAKDEVDNGKLASVMAHLASSLRHIAVLLQPFMTESPKQIMAQLGLDEALLAWDTLGQFEAIPAGTKVVDKGVPIFPRLDSEVEIVYIRDQMAITARPKIRLSSQKVETEVT